ncbi:MAG: DNA mismatch repair protein MutS [Bdellovibrionales bacterium]|nr:DNA mismatch repair protein MutS [Bdellovibrionales bacterium]
MATDQAYRSSEERTGLSPMLELYCEFKERYPDHLLFFQVGDFYEVFFEDAVTAARYLNLTLTSRDKRSENPIPMCGVPLGVIDGYLTRLLDGGFSAAVVSQVEGTENRKGGAERRLERIVTPGIRVLAGEEGGGSGVGQLVSVVRDGESLFHFAASEVESGQISVIENVEESELIQRISLLSPLEIVVADSSSGMRRYAWVRHLLASFGEKLVRFRGVPEPGDFLQARNFSSVRGYVGLAESTRAAVRLLTSYVDESTVDARVEFQEVVAFHSNEVLHIDAHSRLNLEILQNTKDRSSRHTLLEYINRTTTPGGLRLLRQWLLQPLVLVAAIEERQEMVARLVSESSKAESLRSLLSFPCDLERVAARIELGVATPKELASVRDVFEQIEPLLKEGESVFGECALWKSLQSGSFVNWEEPLRSLQEALEDSPGPLHEGNVIRSSYDKRLEEFRNLCRDGDNWLEGFERDERARTGIQSLKVKRNGVLGYFIEVTKANSSKVPSHYIRRQSMVNGERFTTEALQEREKAITEAQGQLLEVERELFLSLRDRFRGWCSVIRSVHLFLSTLDVLVGFAEMARRERLVRPHVTQEDIVSIEEGKHPSASLVLGGKFIPNDLSFSKETRCLILTGPNMGGKSTYLRQAAHLVLLAQIGAFIPAKSATIGIVDRIFARLGASDDLSEGESTFMVEMRECSQILHSATVRSLVLIDEIGRGTATTDGYCLAQSILEWLVFEIGCKTLFATHFHDITGLASRPELAIANIHVGSRRVGDDSLVFTHEILPGAANRSYGLEVAKMAALPEKLLRRARSLLVEYENEHPQREARPQLELFQSPFDEGSGDEHPNALALGELIEKVSEIDPDNLSPKQAHEILYELRRIVEEIEP